MSDTEINFDIPTRYDDATAEQGVWFEVYDEHENHWGNFKCRYLDSDSRAVKLAMDRLRTKFAKDLRTKKPDVADRMALELFLEAVLIGWEGVKAGGKEVPFSATAARAYCSKPKVFKYLVKERLFPECENVLNYPAPDKEAAKGN